MRGGVGGGVGGGGGGGGGAPARTHIRCTKLTRIDGRRHAGKVSDKT